MFESDRAIHRLRLKAKDLSRRGVCSLRVEVSRPPRLCDDLACFLSEARGLQPAHAGGGVGVGVHGQHLAAQVVLHGRQRAAGGGPVRVHRGVVAQVEMESKR